MISFTISSYVRYPQSDVQMPWPALFMCRFGLDLVYVAYVSRTHFARVYQVVPDDTQGKGGLVTSAQAE